MKQESIRRIQTVLVKTIAILGLVFR